MHKRTMEKAADQKEETWEQRKKRLFEEIGSTDVPLGGLSKWTPYEIRHGHDKRRRKGKK